MRTMVCAGLAMLGLVATARADTRTGGIDGTKLLERCTSPKPALSVGCVAYIDGVADAVAVYQEAAHAENDKAAENRICVPASVTGTQMRDTVVTWIRDHREDAGKPSGNLVVHVLRQTWPCH